MSQATLGALHEQAPNIRSAPPENPFPGLRPFEEHEAEYFFGREAHMDALLKKLQRRRLLAVIGNSGSGKSSLVLSGVLPRLHRGYPGRGGSCWRVARMKPGSGPLGNLATALQLAREQTDQDEIAPDKPLLVKEGTAPGLGGRKVSETDVIAIDRELAQLKDQKDHLCTADLKLRGATIIVVQDAPPQTLTATNDAFT